MKLHALALSKYRRRNLDNKLAAGSVKLYTVCCIVNTVVTRVYTKNVYTHVHELMHTVKLGTLQ